MVVLREGPQIFGFSLHSFCRFRSFTQTQKLYMYLIGIYISILFFKNIQIFWPYFFLF